MRTEIWQQGSENVAVFIAEPVVGAALGSVPAPEGYFEKIHEFCDRYQVLFIVEEVMTGFSRLGAWFGMETYGITPNLIACGKGMGAGYVKVGATIAREDLWQTLEPSGVPFMAGHTMNQNPVTCAGALGVIELIEDWNLMQHVQEIDRYLGGRLNEMREHDFVGDVRGGD